ncbi:hypothetical protein [Tolypothrix sp. VBCCA 56010]|uniref:hypothetical protein n=1 Tax=Tolypothrix sp. VBCCA 56010 TaxID=3137731 RepID=UPI003D7CAC81
MWQLFFTIAQLREWGRGGGGSWGGRGRGILPNAQCSMPDARCPMPNAPCPMPNTPFYEVRQK